MKCFDHDSIDAVGVCKSCGRALCHDCISEVGTSCACKARCETDVARINDMILRGSSAYQKASVVYTRAGLFSTIMGVLFACFGRFAFDGHPNFFLLALGLLFFVYGVFQFVTAKRYREP